MVSRLPRYIMNVHRLLKGILSTTAKFIGRHVSKLTAVKVCALTNKEIVYVWLYAAYVYLKTM